MPIRNKKAIILPKIKRKALKNNQLKKFNKCKIQYKVLVLRPKKKQIIILKKKFPLINLFQNLTKIQANLKNK